MNLKRFYFLFLFALSVLSGHVFAAIGIQISSPTWAIGALGANGEAYITVSVSNISTAGEPIKVDVKSANSASWTLSSVAPGQDQFSLMAKGGILNYSTYTFVTSSYVTYKNTLRTGAYFDMDFKFTGPSNSTVGSQQTIPVYFQGSAASGWTYNAAGDFYWKNIGDTATPPFSNWADTESSIMPANYWQYMNGGTTRGWYSSGQNTNTISVVGSGSFIVTKIRTIISTGYRIATALCTPLSHSSIYTAVFSFARNGGVDETTMRTQNYTITQYSPTVSFINSAGLTSTFFPKVSMTYAATASGGALAGTDGQRSISVSACAECGWISSTGGLANTNAGAALGAWSLSLPTSNSVDGAIARIVILN